MLAVVLYLSFYEGLPGIPGGFFTTAHYTELVKDQLAFRVTINTSIYTATAVWFSLLFGVLIAWLVERTDIGGRNLIYTGMTVSLLIPTFFPAMGWLFLLHPRIGFLNVLLRQFFGPDFKLSIATPFGMGWVEGITLAPVVFIMVAANLRMADTTLEEAAKVAGANGWQLFKTVILPLSTPATMAAAFYVSAIAVASFDVPAIIGLSNRVYTLGTLIYEDLVPHQGFPLYGRPAAVSTMLIAVGVLLSIWYLRAIRQANRFQLVSGKSYRPLRYQLRLWRRSPLVFVSQLFSRRAHHPARLARSGSLSNPLFNRRHLRLLAQLNSVILSARLGICFFRAFKNSAILAIGCSCVIDRSSASSIPGWCCARRPESATSSTPWRFSPTPCRPSFSPSAACCFRSLFFANILPLYGTLTLLVAVHVIHRLSFGTRVTNAAIIAVSEELEEAAAACGANRRDVISRILLPLIAPTLINAFFWIALSNPARTYSGDHPIQPQQHHAVRGRLESMELRPAWSVRGHES